MAYPLTKLLKGVSILFIALLPACKKNAAPAPTSPGNDSLWFSGTAVKINQELFVFDSTAAPTDSIAANIRDNYYKWTVTPSGCDSILPGASGGSAAFTFNCPGTYQISAAIYNSNTNKLIGYTDTITINVGPDTLQQTQPIAAGDTLFVSPNIDTTLYPQLQLNFSTSKLYIIYPATLLNCTFAENNNNNYFTFTNVSLETYPYAWGRDTIGRATRNFVWQVFPSTGRDSVKLSITWLGITYTGMVTLTSDNKFSFKWDYDNGVLINPKHN